MLEIIGRLPPLMLAILVGLILLLLSSGVILFGSLYGPRARLQKRIVSVVGSPGAANATLRRPDRNGSERRRGVEAKLREVERLKKSKRRFRLNEELIQAGLQFAPSRFIVMAVASGLILVVLYIITGLPKIGVPLVAIVGMLGIPKFYLQTRIKRRLKRFTALFADAIDIVVRGVRTGLTVGECLTITAREMPDPIGMEFRAITEGIQLGITLDECLNKLYARVPTTEVRFFSIVLVMQQSTGGNLAETLEKLSDVIRSRKRMRDKIQAFSSEAKASAAIVGSLPIVVALALSLISPKYVGLLVTTDIGKWMIVLGIVWMSLGMAVMAKMIRFDF